MFRFHSKAGADVIMLGGHADAVLRALGREPAPEGIFLADQIEAALASFAAFAARRAEEAQQGERSLDDEQFDDAAPDLARRAWPLLDMLTRAGRAGQAVIWSSS